MVLSCPTDRVPPRAWQPAPRAPTDRGVVFDWGGTITPWHTVDLREQWQVFARGAGTMACALTDLASACLQAEDAAWRRGWQDGTSARLDDRSEAIRGAIRAYVA